MKSIYGQPIPADIFKYRSVDGAHHREWIRQILTEDAFYFSTPAQFNDPFDCDPVFSPLQGRDLKEHGSGLVQRAFPDLNRAARRAKEHEIRHTSPSTYRERLASARATMQETGVYSLSAEPADLLMWSHYGSSHRGICLHFDMRVLHDHFTPLEILGLPVNYSDERPSIVVGVDIEPGEFLRRTFLVKAKCWAYEREWRFLHFKGGGGIRRFPSQALQSIILGARISDEDAAFVRALAESRSAPVRVRRTAFNKASYRLEIES